jgi:hypothetical protein
MQEQPRAWLHAHPAKLAGGSELAGSEKSPADAIVCYLLEVSIGWIAAP